MRVLLAGRSTFQIHALLRRVPAVEVHELAAPARPLKILEATRRLRPAVVILDDGSAPADGVCSHLLSIAPDLVVIGIRSDERFHVYRRPIAKERHEGWSTLVELVRGVAAENEETVS